MIGEDFLFNNHWLSDFSMKMYDPQNEQQFIGREIDKAEITPLRQVPNHYSAHYKDTLALQFLIVRDEDVCETWDDMRLSGEDISIIRAWLENANTPTQLTVPLNSDEMTTNYFGVLKYLINGLVMLRRIKYNTGTRFGSISKGSEK